MPTYIFIDEQGNNHERVMSVAQLEKCSRRNNRYRVRGVVGLCRINHEAQASDFQDTPGAWPMESDAAGVHPDQISEHQEALKSVHGVHTEFNPTTGCAIFRDRKHRRKHCEAIGLHDRNGGYGDPHSRT